MGPVEPSSGGVGASDADAYVAWLAATTGRGFRLSTEVEWEYAARGGGDRELPWGEEFDAGRANGDLLRALGTYRITRGGSFARYGDLARTRRRHGPYPGPEYPPGFRVACG